MNAPAKVDVLAVLEAVEAYVDDAAQFPEQFKPGVVKRHQAQFREARAAVAELIETQRRLIEAYGERFGPGHEHATGTLCRDERQYPVILDAMAALARVGGAS